MTKPIYILGYGSLIWDLDDLAPKVTGKWLMGEGPRFPLEFSRISPKRKKSLVVVIDERGDPCPSHAIRSIRNTVAEAADDLAAREHTVLDHIGWVDMAADTSHASTPAISGLVAEWCFAQGAAGAVWTGLDGNFEDFTIPSGIAYLKTLTGESLAAAEEYINCAPPQTDTPLRRALALDPWWQDLTQGRRPVRQPQSVRALETLGRVRLSANFQMREFLYSEIAAMHGLSNMPEDPDLAIATGTRLCEEVLEPLNTRWGRIIVRSGYRARDVNTLGNENNWSCGTNQHTAASHIWDMRDKNGHMGATATIVVPGFIDAVTEDGGWQRLAWWIHDHLPYDSLYFFPKMWAFNIRWHEAPTRRIDSYISPRGCLTKPGMEKLDRQPHGMVRGL